jgi:hypothetical protein
MSQVAVDPGELRALATVLMQCSTEIVERASQMSNAVSGCGSWNDVKKQQLEASINGLYPQILSFHEAINEQFQYLQALASRADDYLST